MFFFVLPFSPPSPPLLSLFCPLRAALLGPSVPSHCSPPELITVPVAPPPRLVTTPPTPPKNHIILIIIIIITHFILFYFIFFFPWGASAPPFPFSLRPSSPNPVKQTLQLLSAILAGLPPNLPSTLFTFCPSRPIHPAHLLSTFHSSFSSSILASVSPLH